MPDLIVSLSVAASCHDIRLQSRRSQNASVAPMQGANRDVNRQSRQRHSRIVIGHGRTLKAYQSSERTITTIEKSWTDWDLRLGRNPSRQCKLNKTRQNEERQYLNFNLKLPL
jgi:hypothetical protein